jgi:hypothetical protein
MTEKIDMGQPWEYEYNSLRIRIQALENSLSGFKLAVYFLLFESMLIAIWAIADSFRK